ASFYDQALADIEGGVTPKIEPQHTSIYNQDTIRVLAGRRDELRQGLQARGGGSGAHRPVPPHLQECFNYLGYGGGEFPESERACREVLSLPVYPELGEEQLAYVVASIRAVLEG